MKIKRLICLTLMCLVAVNASAAQSGDRNFGIIPAPMEISANGKEFKVGPKDKLYIYFQDEEGSADAAFLDTFLQDVCGVNATLSSKKVPSKAKTIIFDESYNGPEEGYTLNVSESAVTLSGKGAGLFYALQSLEQLILYCAQDDDCSLSVPGVNINDQPRFGYRGIMQESGYHIYPIDFIKQEIDYLAKYKLNIYHWHLTEDEGWRIESKKFPRLNEISSWRDQTWVSNYDRDYEGLDGTRYGGYYTQDEIREVVKYAQERHVTIIPEVELPGHTSAVLAAYPNLGCTGGPYEVQPYWGIFEEVFCAGKEETFHFLEELLDEVMDLFPGYYFHIGGDECPKTSWSKCPLCQQRIKDEGLKDEYALQSYFIKRIEKYLNSKGRHIIGWDEIREGGLAPDATVMNWREPIEGILSAQQGHDVINACNEWVYFDHLQDVPDQEPLGIGGYLPCEKVYNYDPMYAELTPDEQKHVIGVEAPLWTEFVETPQKFAYMLYPRVFALSEICWSPNEVKDSDNFFKERLPKHLGDFDSKNIVYRVPNPVGLPETVQRGGEFTMELFCPVEGAKIYYNFDGQTPRETDYIYEGPVKIVVPEGTMRMVKAITITPSGKRSTVSTAIYDNRHGTEYLVGEGISSLEPGTDLFSTALAGYGAPVEGRFSLDWNRVGNISEFSWIEAFDDQTYAGQSCPDGKIVSAVTHKGRVIALTENSIVWRKDITDKNAEWIKIGYNNGLTFDFDAKKIALKDDRLYAVDPDGVVFENVHKSNGNLKARATAIGKDGKTVVMISLDLTGFDYSFTQSVKRDITASTGIPAEAVLINATHTHFAPVSQCWYSWHEPVQYPDERYMEEIVRPAILAAVNSAVANLHPCHLFFGRTNSYIGDHRSLRGEKAYYDPSVDIVEVVNKDDELENVIFRAGCHAVFDDRDKFAYYTIDGNFPAICKDLLQATLKTKNALFLQGCAGDVNPVDSDCEGTARVLAGSVIDRMKGKMETVDGDISYAMDSVLFKTTPMSVKDLKAMKAAAEPYDDAGSLRNVRYANIQLDRLKNKTMPEYMPVYVQTINIGDWKIVALSREVAGRYGLEIRNIWPDRNVTVLGYSNDVSSYLPSIEHIQAGTYEGNDSFFWYSQPNIFPENVLDVIVSEIRKNNR